MNSIYCADIYGSAGQVKVIILVLYVRHLSFKLTVRVLFNEFEIHTH